MASDGLRATRRAARQRLAVGGREVGALIALAVFVGLVAIPLARLTGTLADAGSGAVAVALAGAGGRALVTSLGLGLVVGVLAVTLGTAMALVAEQRAGTVRRWVRIAMVGQLVVPPFVSGLGWAAAYGPRGLSDRLLGISLPGMYGAIGVALVLAIEATPLVYLVVAGAMAACGEADLERAARASGATALDALRSVTLPLLRPAIAASGILAFVLTLNAFGVPAVLGLPGGVTTMTTRLYQDLAFSADPAAFDRAVVLAMVLVVLGVGAVAIADGVLAGRPMRRTAVTSMPAGPTGRAGRIGVVMIALAIVLTAVVPSLALVLVSLTRAVGVPPTPDNWTLANFAAVLDARTMGALANSVLLGITAATVVTLLGGLIVAVGRRLGRALGSLASIGFAVPGSTLALAVLIGYGGALRDSLGLILVAYLAKFWALGYRSLAATSGRLPPDLARAARASGAPAATTLRTVVVPLLATAIVGAWFVVFVFALHEVTMSSLLYGPGTATLAVVVLNVQQLGDPTDTAALAVLLTGVVLLAALPILVLRRVVGRPEARE